jgi:hypothetical protein
MQSRITEIHSGTFPIAEAIATITAAKSKRSVRVITYVSS